MNNKKLYIYHSFLSRRKDLGQFHSIKELIHQLDYIENMGFNTILTRMNIGIHQEKCVKEEMIWNILNGEYQC